MYTFVETRLFTRLVSEYLSDEEYAAMQVFLLMHPEVGAIVRGSGGVRKLRWGAERRGKRGGVRVIYYLKNAAGQIWLLTLYAKNVRESIPASILRKIKEEVDDA